MKTNHVFIDFENVQPKNLQLLLGHPVKVYVFVGANQSKVPLEVAQAMQTLGADACYVQIEGSGRNALDFHIAFYLGRLLQEDPQGYYHIISKDTGFDPLAKHLKSHYKAFVRRSADLSEISILQLKPNSTPEEKIACIRESLTQRGTSRPRKEKTLANTINALFQKQLPENEIAALIKQLIDENYIAMDGGKIAYLS